MINWNEEKIREIADGFINTIAKEMDYKKESISLDEVNIAISSRLSRSLGVCKSQTKNGKYKTLEIAISKRMLSLYEDELIIDVIGHEVAHHIANTLKGTSQGHNGFFKDICSVLDVSGTTINKKCYDYKKSNYNEILEQIHKNKSKKTKKTKKTKRTLSIRYVQECTSCGAKIHYKTARKDSIRYWLSNFMCHCGNDKFYIYDLKENMKYYIEDSEIISEEMSTEDIKELNEYVKKHS